MTLRLNVFLFAIIACLTINAQVRINFIESEEDNLQLLTKHITTISIKKGDEYIKHSSHQLTPNSLTLHGVTEEQIKNSEIEVYIDSDAGNERLIFRMGDYSDKPDIYLSTYYQYDKNHDDEYRYIAYEYDELGRIKRVEFGSLEYDMSSTSNSVILACSYNTNGSIGAIYAKHNNDDFMISSHFTYQDNTVNTIIINSNPSTTTTNHIVLAQYQQSDLSLGNDFWRKTPFYSDSKYTYDYTEYNSGDFFMNFPEQTSTLKVFNPSSMKEIFHGDFPLSKTANTPIYFHESIAASNKAIMQIEQNNKTLGGIAFNVDKAPNNNIASLNSGKMYLLGNNEYKFENANKPDDITIPTNDYKIEYQTSLGGIISGTNEKEYRAVKYNSSNMPTTTKIGVYNNSMDQPHSVFNFGYENNKLTYITGTDKLWGNIQLIPIPDTELILLYCLDLHSITIDKINREALTNKSYENDPLSLINELFSTKSCFIDLSYSPANLKEEASHLYLFSMEKDKNEGVAIIPINSPKWSDDFTIYVSSDAYKELGINNPNLSYVKLYNKNEFMAQISSHYLESNRQAITYINKEDNQPSQIEYRTVRNGELTIQKDSNYDGQIDSEEKVSYK